MRRPPAELVVQGLPLALVAVLAVFMVERDGGFAPTVWYGVGLVVLAFVVTLVWSSGRRFGALPGRLVAAIALFAAFTAWQFLSIVWAAVPGDAWTGANRSLYTCSSSPSSRRGR